MEQNHYEKFHFREPKWSFQLFPQIPIESNSPGNHLSGLFDYLGSHRTQEGSCLGSKEPWKPGNWTALGVWQMGSLERQLPGESGSRGSKYLWIREVQDPAAQRSQAGRKPACLVSVEILTELTHSTGFCQVTIFQWKTFIRKFVTSSRKDTNMLK